MLLKRAILPLTILLWASPSVLAECVRVLPRIEPLLRASTHILVGRVVGGDAEMSVIRAWKGGRRDIVLSYSGAGPCDTPLIRGRVYLAFLDSTAAPLELDWVCERWAQAAITRLDRWRGFPPLSLPSEDLCKPSSRARGPSNKGLQLTRALGAGAYSRDGWAAWDALVKLGPRS